MITTTLDPITLNDVTDLENAPYVVEAEKNKQEYLNTEVHGSDMSGLKDIYDDIADNPNTGSIN